MPSTRLPAMISPQSAIGPGFLRTTSMDVAIAVPTPTSRSISRGKETTLSTSTASAKTNPTTTPTIAMVQPARVVSTSCAKASSDTGGSGPSVSSQMMCAAPSHSTNIASSTSPSAMMEPSAGELATPKASAQPVLPGRVLAGGSSRRGRSRRTARSARNPTRAGRAAAPCRSPRSDAPARGRRSDRAGRGRSRRSDRRRSPRTRGAARRGGRPQ